MIRLGEAAYDERGALAYGQPGDQTGMEVRIVDLYNAADRPWTKVFRAKKKEVRDKLALAMTQACNNNNIGYAQYGDGSTPYKDRLGLNEAMKQAPSHTLPDVTIPCNCDCSSLVAQCCRAAGVDVPVTMYTATEVMYLRNTGMFDELDFSIDMVFVPGDILWRQGHTAIIVSASNEPSTQPKWVGRVIKDCDVHTQPNSTSSLLPQWPHLGVGNLVDVCDEDTGFFYVRIAGQHFGWVEKICLENADHPTTPYNQEPQWVATVLTYCNVYQSPSTGAALLSQWPHLGATNLVDVCDEDGDFWYIRIAGKYFGFVLKSCLSEEPKPTFEPFNGKVTTQLNVRTGPGVTYGFCTFNRNDGLGDRHTLKKDEVVTVIGEKNNWYQLDLAENAWCNSSYIIKIEEPVIKVGDSIILKSNILYTSKDGLDGTIKEVGGNDWFKIETSDGCIGYISKDDIEVK